MGQVFHFEFSHARIKIAVHIGSVGVMISKLVIDQVFLVRVVAILDERDNLIVQWNNSDTTVIRYLIAKDRAGSGIHDQPDIGFDTTDFDVVSSAVKTSFFS